MTLNSLYVVIGLPDSLLLQNQRDHIFKTKRKFTSLFIINNHEVVDVYYAAQSTLSRLWIVRFTISFVFALFSSSFSKNKAYGFSTQEQ